jgi:hypothetical protein
VLTRTLTLTLASPNPNPHPNQDCTYGLGVPSSYVLYLPEAQGSLPPGAPLLYVRCTRTSLGRALRPAYRGTTGARFSEPSSATRAEPAPSEAQRVICALALGTVEAAPRPGKRPLAPPSYWIGV